MSTKAPPQRAAGYIRVSQVAGREGDSFMSPELQRERIEAWAAYRGYELTAWYVDLDRPASKGSPPRPEFERMMADAAANKFDAVAVYRMTRFARSVADASKRYDELEKAGVDLVSVTEDIDTTTSNGRFMRHLLSALAEFESDRIGEAWKEVHNARRRRGVTHITHAVLGYDIKGGEIVGVDEEQAETVRRAFELRRAGHGLRQISVALEREGRRTATGAPRFVTSTLGRILSNPLYVGLISWNGELIAGQHEALVSRELFEAVQALRGVLNDRATHRASMLAGLIYCGSCGYKLACTGEGNGRGRVYRCRARQRRYAIDCTHPVSIRADPTDAFIDAQFQRIMGTGMERPVRRRDCQVGWEGRAARHRAKAEQLTRAIDDLGDARFVTQTIDQDEYARLFARFAEQRGDELAKAERLETLERTQGGRSKELVTAVQVWHALDAAARRRVLAIAIERIDVLPSPNGASRISNPEERLAIRWSGC